MSMRYFLHSLGCKVNSYETSAIGTEFKSEGMEQVQSASEADVIVLNTCSVTARADQKSRQHISSYRKGNPNAVLIVMGCYSQTHAEQAISLGADIVIGASSRHLIGEYLSRFLAERQPICDVKESLRKENYEELGFTSFCENARAYLKVQDGCNNFCSYCFIPYLRGNSRSRDPRLVVEEAQRLVEAGYQELIVTGIHIGAYGRDLPGGEFRLADLLDAILRKCPHLPRLRISSIEETEIDDRFLELLEKEPRIVDHLHIPLQSGSPSVLRRMKRKYDTDAFLAKLDAIRKIRPDIAITTDVIAGFPEETDEEWQETISFCQAARFSEIHVFPFSPRPGTPASEMKDVAPEVKKKRVRELMDLSASLRADYEASFHGKEMEVLFENYDEKKHLAYGHTSNYLMVAIPSEKPLHGQWQKIIYNSSIASD